MASTQTSVTEAPRNFKKPDWPDSESPGTSLAIKAATPFLPHFVDLLSTTPDAENDELRLFRNGITSKAWSLCKKPDFLGGAAVGKHPLKHTNMYRHIPI